MKKVIHIILVVILVVILFPKLMGYDGGFTGGETKFTHCIGIKFSTENKGPVMPDAITGSTYCVGIPFR